MIRILRRSKDIKLINPPSSAAAITTALAQNPHLTSLPLPKPDLLAPSSLSQNTPTAEILRHPEIQAAITGDFIVLPCDLVCELPGESLLEAWMIHQGGLGGASFASDEYRGAKMGLGGEGGGRRGGLGVWFETKGEDSIKGAETDFVITTSLPQPAAPPPEGSLRPHMAELLYATTTDTLRDITEEKKGFPIRHGLIKKHGRIKMLTTHRDAHIYLFPYWVLDMIKRNEHIDSISEDVVGWWAKAGWQKGLPEKLSLHKVLDPTLSSEQDNDREGGSHASGNIEDEIDLASMSSTHISVLTKNLSTTKPPLSVPPFLSYIHPKTTGASTPSPLIRRVDTPHLLLHTSLHLATLPPSTNPPPNVYPTGPSPLSHSQKISTDPSLIAPHTNIHAPTTLIAPNTTVATHCVIKSSVIGANCVIDEGVRLTGCLLMDGVTVGEKAVLQGCILGRRCVVGKGSNLKECEVQEGYQVTEETEAKGEKMMVFEGLDQELGEEEDEADGEGIMLGNE
ncbi:MAG: hypothetical protein ASARMPRED_000565 [Alectoria sarmentosa]|nr:MAG: hypothetical protein ASARMPRED_000565 [Alectoria sarmentosa]